MQLSIVSSIYYGEPYLREFYERIGTAAESITSDFEIILVNDASPDDALNVALDLRRQDPRVKVIDLARNYGHTRALMAGLAYATGAYIFQTGCNLEETPESLTEFHKEIKRHKGEIDVVWAKRNDQFDRPLQKLIRKVYYNTLKLVTLPEIPLGDTVTRLMTRRYVDCLNQHREAEAYLPGLWMLTGFKQVPLVIMKQAKGSKRYRLKQMGIKLVDSIVSFSNKPLIWIFYLGTAILSFSFIWALYLIVQRLFSGHYPPGFTSILVTIWSLGGLVIFTIGVIGIYLSKIYTEAKRRPYSLIKEVYQKSDSQGTL